MRTLFKMLVTGTVVAVAFGSTAMSGDPDQVKFSVLVGVLAVGYLLPTFIAFGRGHSNAAGIMIFNIFLGWTFVSWIVCLIMSLANAAPLVVHHVHTGHVEHYPNPGRRSIDS